MMKLSRLLQLRNSSEKLLFVKSSGFKDGLMSNSFSSLAGLSSASQNVHDKGYSSSRTFAPYYIYKGKAALSVQPVLPTFTKSDYGGRRLDRRGSLMLSFCPAIGERKYDREKRQLFALSATEVGSLISLGSKESSEFFHDPSMKSSNAGQVRKSLAIKPQADGNGYLISLSVMNNLLKTSEKFMVPVTTAEFAVIKAACKFALPHIMGWDQATVPFGEKGDNPSKINLQNRQSEWER